MQAGEEDNCNKLRVDDCTDMKKPPRPRSDSVSSDRSRGKRSSLIITHEDGTVEENFCLVTNLGFSNLDSEQLRIEEIGQKHTEVNMPFQNNRLNSPEIVTVDVHRDPDDDIPTSVTRDKSPLLEIETLPNSPVLSPLPPQSPSISLSPSPHSFSPTVSPTPCGVEATRPLDSQDQLLDSSGSLDRVDNYTTTMESQEGLLTGLETGVKRNALKIPIQLEGEERSFSSPMSQKNEVNISLNSGIKDNAIDGIWNADNESRIEMGVENGAAAAIMKTFCSPKTVRRVPINIEMESDTLKTSTDNVKHYTDQHRNDHKIPDISNEHERVIPIKFENKNFTSNTSTSPMDYNHRGDLKNNKNTTCSANITVPINVEVSTTISNMSADIDLVTKPPERINKHSMEQTPQLGTPQQTETLNGELNNEKESLREKVANLRTVPITFTEPQKDKEKWSQSLHMNMDRIAVSQNKYHPSINQQDWSKPISAKPPQGKQSVLSPKDNLNSKFQEKTHQEKGSEKNILNGNNTDLNFQNIHIQLEDAKQKLEEQMNRMISCDKDLKKVEPRSRSVGAESRSVGSRTKKTSARYSFRRERSLEDIDKDIATIWKELQELDQLPESKSKLSTNKASPRISAKPDSAKAAPVPLSEQELVIPSWRTSTPPVHRKSSTPNMFPNKRSSSPSGATRTIWDPPNEHADGVLAKNHHILSPKPHFSFVPKAETKPGAITPNFVTISTRPSRSSKKTKSTLIEDSKVENEVINNVPSRSQSMPRNQTEWPECYNSFHKIQSQSTTGAKPKESTPLKSCLKSDSRGNSLTRNSKTRSKSPSSRASPAKQNVNFKQEVNKYDTDEKEIEIPEQPYEVINVRTRKLSGESPKVKTPVMSTKVYESKNMRVVPIVRDGRIMTDHSLTAETASQQSTEMREVPIQIQQNKNCNLNKINLEDERPNKSPIKTAQFPHTSDREESKKEAPLATEEACYACDACTQTDKKDKKEACHVM